MTGKNTEKISVKAAFRLCLPIGVIIFVTAILSDISVKLYTTGGANIIMGIIMDFAGIIIVTSVLAFMVIDSKKYRNMITRMFGVDDENEKN